MADLPANALENTQPAEDHGIFGLDSHRYNLVMRQQSNLDFMRAIAICLVVLDHTMIALGLEQVGRLHFGWVGVFGVYLFFVHTCLVLMWSLERRPNTLNFYLRRIFRIYPLAIVTSLLIVAVPLFRDSLSVPPTPAALASNLLLIQNLWKRGFTEGVMWSLPLEVEMYVLLPALFAFARKEKSRWPIFLLLGLAVAFARADEPAPRGNDLITVIPHFLPGVIAYIGFMFVKPRIPAWCFPCMLAVMLAWFLVNPSVERAWPICACLGFALPYFHSLSNEYVVQLSHILAKYSYSIYLLHLLAIEIAFRLFTRNHIAVKLLVELACIAIFSFLAYHAVEEPLIRRGAIFADRLQARLNRRQSVETASS